MNKKILVLGIIVLFIGMSITPSTAVTIQKETSEDKETTDTFEMLVSVKIPFEHYNRYIYFAVVTIENEEGTLHLVNNTGSTGRCRFDLPMKYRTDPSGLIFTAKHWLAKQKKVDLQHWHLDLVSILMEYKHIRSRTVDNPFFNHFPILKQLLHQLA